MTKVKSRLIRVGVRTNFNHTVREERELIGCVRDGDRVFANSNAKTKIKRRIPTVVTVNPDLDEFVEPRGLLLFVKALRVKLVLNPTFEVENALVLSVLHAIKHGFPLLLTAMRFRRRETMEKFCADVSAYHLDGAWFKPDMLLIERRLEFTRNIHKQTYLCDHLQQGCPACGLCGALTFGKAEVPFGLDLESSLPNNEKHCKYSCPDCWSKYLHYRCRGRVDTGKVKRNMKMKGRVRH